MRNKYALLSLVVLVGFSFACSPSAKKSANKEIENMPWYMLRPPADTAEFLYSTGSQVSVRREMALSQAELNSQVSMASKLGTKIEALQKRFAEEISEEENSNYTSAFTQAFQSVVSQTISGHTIEERTYVPMPDGRFEVFVLLKMPVGAARQQLDRALSRDQEMYIKFKESQAFKEMQDALERL